MCGAPGTFARVRGCVRARACSALTSQPPAAPRRAPAPTASARKTLRRKRGRSNGAVRELLTHGHIRCRRLTQAAHAVGSHRRLTQAAHAPSMAFTSFSSMVICNAMDSAAHAGRCAGSQIAGNVVGGTVHDGHVWLSRWSSLWRGSTPCLLYTSPSPRDRTRSRMPSSA